MKKNYTKGFTLIELLVVIAIIGILSSVVLVSLNSARGKGKDSHIISDVQQLRTQLESDSAGSSYNNGFTANGANIWLGSVSGTTYSALIADAVANTSVSSPSVTVSTTTVATNTAFPATAAIVVVTNGAAASSAFTTNVSAYAIYGKQSTGTWFCIDSTGKTNTAVSAANATISCP